MRTQHGFRFLIIKHSNRFWEVVPPTKKGMAILLRYIQMIWDAPRPCLSCLAESGHCHAYDCPEAQE